MNIKLKSFFALILLIIINSTAFSKDKITYSGFLDNYPEFQKGPKGGADWVYNLALKQGVVVTPGVLFSSQDRYSSFLRISFAHEWSDQRTQAVKMLGRLVQSKTVTVDPGTSV